MLSASCLPFPPLAALSAHGKLAQIRSVRLCCGGGTWARWRQANWAKAADLTGRADEMHRPRLAHQPLVAGQPTVGHDRQPAGNSRGCRGHAAQQSGHVAAEFQDHKRCGALGQFVPAIGQRSRFPNANARLGQFASQAPRPSVPCVRRQSAAPQRTSDAMPAAAKRSGIHISLPSPIPVGRCSCCSSLLSPLFESQLHHAPVEPGAGHAEQPGRPGLVALRPGQGPTDQFTFDTAEILV